MLEKILSRRNLLEACKQVVSNRGSSGVDGMNVHALKEYVSQNLDALRAEVRTEEYQGSPILGIEIPKTNGKTRLLGIPTVVDRLLQQAVHQIIYPAFELEFKDESYGFRPERNAHQAIRRAMKNIQEGYDIIIDIDLKSFFDEVDHGLLLSLLYRKVKCPQTMRLIRQWLRAPIWIGGKLGKRRRGIPQGSPLSPLLSNIMLHELDTELAQRGHRFVRYADDFSIYVKSKKAARRVGNGIYLFLRDKLQLPINRDKSGIRQPKDFQILGHKIVRQKKDQQVHYRLAVKASKWQELKRELRKVTGRRAPLSFDERVAKLKSIHRGWLNYFCLAKLDRELIKLDRWVRTRLRCCIWVDWKKPNRRRINLQRLGVDYDHAYSWSNTRMGAWAVAQSPILHTTLTLARLQRRGYESMTSYYETIALQFNEPLYT